jgi:predicted O-methyltransferase YrrM
MVPAWMEPTFSACSSEELNHANEIRRKFLLPRDPEPFMVDIVRAMRLLKGRRRYVEVGTYDKGCLAYLSGLLAPDSTLVDVDIDARPAQSKLLREYLPASQSLKTLVVDSTDTATVAAIIEALGGEKADAIFIDGNHAAAYVWSDYALALEILAPGGIILFHDIFWEGNDETIGAAKAMEWIDRATPVYAIHGNDPVTRFFPDLIGAGDLWGCVGVIRP